jgi:ABC-2 type transport system ATP-binding protein
MPEPVLRVEGLRKTYGDTVAVDDVSLTVQPGEILGLLGPNGAGKTTTLECLEGLRRPDAGRLSVLGLDPTRETRGLWDRIGVQLQTSALPSSMRVDEAMLFFAAYHGVAPRVDLLERLGLAEKRRALYSELSVGQQRRLALALALVHNPPLVFLDEPTAGLDVASRVELHTMIQELRAQGTTLILATHDMAEAEKLADRVGILLRGRLVSLGSPRHITSAGASWTKVSVRTENACLTADDAPDLPHVLQEQRLDEYAVYYSSDPGPTVTAILAHIEAQGDRLVDLRVERPSLEERFLELTREEAS